MSIVLTNKNVVKVNGKWTISHPSFKGKQGIIAVKTEWCGYCKRLKPEYEKVAGLTGKTFPLATLDGDTYAGLVSQMGVTSYPTIRFVDVGGVIGETFTGDRTVTGFMAGICSKARAFCK